MNSTPFKHSNRLSTRFIERAVVFLCIALGSVTLAAPAQAVAPTIGNFAPITTVWGVGAVTITPPTSNSSGAWSYVSGNTNVATVSGSTLIIIGVGTTTLTAVQTATAQYEQGSVSASLTVAPAVPTIGAFPAINTGIDQRTVTISAPTSPSAGAWTYTSSNTSVATISGNIATILAIGSTTITATQAANWNWAAVTIQTTLNVSGGAPTLGAFPDLVVTRGAVQSVTLVPPTSNSNGAWRYISSNTAVATITGSLLIPVALGTTTITAIQEASGSYGIGSKSMTVTIQGGPPTVGVLADITYALKPFESNDIALVAPTSNSTGTWSFTSSDMSTVAISGFTAKALKIGSVTITAVQAASASYGPSTPLTMKINVTGAAPILGAWADIASAVGATDLNLAPPTSTSAGAWTITSANPSIVEISGVTGKIKGAGQVVITATQAANWNWIGATVTRTVTISGTIPTVGQLVAMEAGLGDPIKALVPPTSNSTGVWAWISSNPTVASISGSQITFLTLGTVTITAIQSASGNYAASTPVTTTLTIKPRPTVGEFSGISTSFGAVAPAIIPPTSNSTGAWSYSSSVPGVVTFTGGVMQVVAVGSATITATQASTTAFAPVTRTFTVTVLPIKPTIGEYKPVTVNFSATPITLAPPTSNSPGTWVYNVIDPNIATVVNGQLVTKSAGETAISARQSLAGNYTSEVVATSLIVKPVVKVSAVGRVISISVLGAAAQVTINGKKVKAGSIKVGPGSRLVKISIGGQSVYSRTFKIK